MYTHEKIANTVTRIRGCIGEWMYLVEGATQALLIDTGIGAGRLDSYVETLTDKPIVVALTHGHLDHMGGSTLFSSAYLNELDWSLAATQIDRNRRFAYATRGFGANVTLDDFSPEDLPTFLPLCDGQTIDLGGGVRVTFFALPGHSQGCMTALIENEQMLLLGDACSENNFFISPECSSLENYTQALAAFLPRCAGRYTKALSSHRSGMLQVDTAYQIHAICQALLNKKLEGTPFSYMGMNDLYIAYPVDSKMVRQDGGYGNIIYRKS
ncbi:MAG: MBL fold metallo-hydrolase [Sphaerochaetaceae bacterium]